MNGVKAVRCTEKIIRRLGATANAREFGNAVRLDVEFPASLDDGGRDRVVPATGAQGGDFPLIVAPGITNLVGRQRRVM